MFKQVRWSRQILFGGADWKLLKQEVESWLESPFAEVEILCVINQLGKQKALGTDGFNGEFFKKARNTIYIKDDLLKVFQEFFNNGMVNKRRNETCITLIPKKKGL